ncbi:lactoylglutathione lyase [Caulobacter sp. Root655]|uniref:VOC family protein n=1 Tax=Caulobacter sp. Root655 TaxID=1736578 RepID=UPI0007018D76|nr:VOC family protein [Caulobacter sp. Root655]KRA65918.1 lactoylglutathione lyase [Caulobacter sp. Root655]
MRLLGIDHVVLRVLDPAAMERFYVEVLGCAVERRQDEIGLVQLRAGAQLIDLVDVAGRLGRAGGPGPGKEGHNMDHLCLRVVDFEVEAARAHLEAQGVTVGDVGLRYGSTGEATSLYLSDPEGNGLELRA